MLVLEHMDFRLGRAVAKLLDDGMFHQKPELVFGEAVGLRF
jgi:hypothetical protein